MGLANTQTALYLLMTHQQCEGDLYATAAELCSLAPLNKAVML